MNTDMDINDDEIEIDDENDSGGFGDMLDDAQHGQDQNTDSSTVVKDPADNSSNWSAPRVAGKNPNPDWSFAGQAQRGPKNPDDPMSATEKKAVSPNRRYRRDRKGQINMKCNPDLLQGFYDALYYFREGQSDVFERFAAEYVKKFREETEDA